MNYRARTAAIRQFTHDLMNCCDMTDRKNAILWLATIIGTPDAHAVARLCGLDDQYYFSA